MDIGRRDGGRRRAKGRCAERGGGLERGGHDARVFDMVTYSSLSSNHGVMYALHTEVAI